MFAEGLKRGVGGGELFVRHAARGFDSVDGGKGDLVLGGIFAGRFAELLRGGLDVEKVIDDLESEADGFAVLRERFVGGGCGEAARGDGTEADAGAEEGAGFGAVDFFEEFGGGGLMFAFEIVNLAADHAAYGAGGDAQLFDEGEALGVVERGRLGEDLEGEREQRIAGEDGHGVAEDFVVGGAAAPEIVVVERGEVVVDERIGVDHFERAGGREYGIGVAAERFCGGESEDGAHSLASGEEGVAHGAVDDGGLDGLGWDERFQCGLDALALPVQVGVEIKHSWRQRARASLHPRA